MTGHTSCRVCDSLFIMQNANRHSLKRIQLRKFFIAQTTIFTFSSRLKNYLLICLCATTWTLGKHWRLMSQTHPSRLARLSFHPNFRGPAPERLHLNYQKELGEVLAEIHVFPPKKKSNRDLLLRFLKFESVTTVRIPPTALMKSSKRTSLSISLLSKPRHPVILLIKLLSR